VKGRLKRVGKKGIINTNGDDGNRKKRELKEKKG